MGKDNQVVDIEGVHLEEKDGNIQDEFEKINAEVGFTYDVCMVFNIGSKSKQISFKKGKGKQKKMYEISERQWFAKNTRRLEECLIKAKLKVYPYLSIQRDELYILVGASEERLKKQAEFTKYDLELDAKEALEQALALGDPLSKASVNDDIESLDKSIWSGVHAPFMAASKDYPLREKLYAKYERDSIFRPIDRIKLIWSIIQTAQLLGGAGLYVESELSAKDTPLISVFALHEHEGLNSLNDKFTFRSFMRGFPIYDLRNYFGEKVTFYFAFLQHYCRCLMLPALLGIAAWVHQLLVGVNEAWSAPILAGIISIGAAFFAELWKRKEARYRYEWGMTNFRTTEEPQPGFKGTWAHSEVNGRLEETFEWSRQLKRLVFSHTVIGIFLAVVISIVVAIFQLRKKILETTEKLEGQIYVGLISFVQIQILNAVYKKFSLKLNTYENHRTRSANENYLITKSFIFKFVNSYNSLFYIAFFKKHETRTIQTDVEGVTVDIDEPGCGLDDPHCLDALTIQLATLFASSLIFNNCIEYFGPKYKTWRANKQERAIPTLDCSLFTDLKDYKEDAEKSYAELQYEKEEYEGTFSDYDEIVIQYGYVIMFVICLPITPLLALISVFVEYKLDSQKLLKIAQRPKPEGADNIGTWLNLMSMLSNIAVFTNIALAFFATDLGEELSEGDPNKKWVWFLGLEHGIFLFKFIVDYLIPDEPHDISMKIRRQKYIGDLLIRGIEAEEEKELNEDEQEKNAAQLEFEYEKAALTCETQNILGISGFKRAVSLVLDDEEDKADEEKEEDKPKDDEEEEDKPKNDEEEEDKPKNEEEEDKPKDDEESKVEDKANPENDQGKPEDEQ